MKMHKGFSLIELAIVLVIVTILIGGLAVPLSAQIEARRIAETNKVLEEARDAIVGYAMSHKTAGTAGPPSRPYLPCPNSDGSGIEDARSAHKCPSQYGWLPWVTLGVGNQDAWGNRLRYATNTDVSNDNVGISSAMRTPPPGPVWNQICSSTTCTSGDIAADVPVVVLSHGVNGWGARNVNSNTLAMPTGMDEINNLVTTSGLYVSRTPTKPGDPRGEFDDIVTWISFNALIKRICPDGGCL
jgi:prepilin-type N-terminal cleavage/methylation domain-containing protein